MLRCNESELHGALLGLKSSEAGIVTLHSNGLVTLISRRRLNEHNARKNGRSRVASHRLKRKCNGDPPLYSASDSASEKPEGGRGGNPKFEKPRFDEMEFHALKIGLPPTEIDKFFNHYEANGWKVGRNPMRSWQAAMVNWRTNYQAGTYASNSRTTPKSDRNAGTYNEGRAGQYARAAVSGAKKIPDVPNSERSDP